MQPAFSLEKYATVRQWDQNKPRQKIHPGSTNKSSTIWSLAMVILVKHGPRRNISTGQAHLWNMSQSGCTSADMKKPT